MGYGGAQRGRKGAGSVPKPTEQQCDARPSEMPARDRGSATRIVAMGTKVAPRSKPPPGDAGSRILRSV
jgi:hypothetical protein